MIIERAGVAVALLASALIWSQATPLAAEEVEEDIRYTPQRLINLPTGHNLSRRELNVAIMHRFLANLRDPQMAMAEDLWGLDHGALMSFELSYGITDWLSFGFHRSTNQRMIEGLVRLTLLREFKSDGWSLQRSNWFTFAIQAGIAQATTPDTPDSAAGNFHLILAKRLFPFLHIYAVPAITTAAHYDQSGPEEMAGTRGEEDISTVGYGLYIAPSANSSFRIVAEHFPGIRRFEDYYDTWGAGFHLSTGAHTFSIFVTNSLGTTLDLYSQASVEDELHLGFNMVRRFNFAKE